jgi:hypothetical protein
MTVATELTLAGAAAMAVWLLGYVICLLLTRNGAVEPGPATQEFGADPEPPAVVSLLADGWRSVDHAAGATLLDLAARGFVEIRQPGDSPAESTVHLLPAPEEALLPFEQRVLARTVAQAGTSGAPIGAITFRARERATAWNRELRREIVAETRKRGLSRIRFGPLLVNVLMAGALVPAALFGLAVLSTGRVRPAVAVAVVAAVPPFWLMLIGQRERSTDLGRSRAGHWLGIASWLRAHEDFAQLPPASVAVWDRYPGYGAALGVTTRINQLLDFGSGDSHWVWSSYGGSWRRVRIHYPRLLPGYGATPLRLLQGAAAAATVAVGLVLFALIRRPDWVQVVAPGEHTMRRPGLLLSAGWVLVAALGIVVAGRATKWLPFLAFLALMPGNFAGKYGIPAPTMPASGLLPAETAAVCLFGALTLHYLVLLVLSRTATRTLTGEVLRIETRRSARAPRCLALDQGVGDRTVACALPTELPIRFATGSTVRVTVERATRRVRAVEVVDIGSEFRLQRA